MAGRIATSLRRRFELVPGQHRPRPVRNGLIFLAVLGALLYAGFTRSIPLWPEGGDVYLAEFDRADYIRSGVPVRVAGVEVGEVEEVERQPDGSGALVRFRIKDDDVTVRRDAHANLWWRTLLGFNYEMELFPGSPGQPELDGDEPIPQRRNETQVSFDEVFRPLDDSGRGAIRTLIGETDEAFEGDSAGRVLERLGPAMRNVAPGMDALRGVGRGDLSRLVDRTGRAMRAVGREQEHLAGLVTGGATALSAIAGQRGALGQTVDEGPETIAESQRTMVRLRATLDQLDPLARELRPGARRLDDAAAAGRAALRQADPLLRDARPLLRDLRPALASLGRAGGVGKPLIDDLQPTVDRSARELVPWLDRRDGDTELRNYAAIGPFFAHVGSLAAQYNVNGHQVHFVPGAGESLIGGAPCQTYLADPSEEQKIRCDNLTSVLGSVMGGR